MRFDCLALTTCLVIGLCACAEGSQPQRARLPGDRIGLSNELKAAPVNQPIRLAARKPAQILVVDPAKLHVYQFADADILKKAPLNHAPAECTIRIRNTVETQTAIASPITRRPSKIRKRIFAPVGTLYKKQVPQQLARFDPHLAKPLLERSLPPLTEHRLDAKVVLPDSLAPGTNAQIDRSNRVETASGKLPKLGTSAVSAAYHTASPSFPHVASDVARIDDELQKAPVIPVVHSRPVKEERVIHSQRPRTHSRQPTIAQVTDLSLSDLLVGELPSADVSDSGRQKASQPKTSHAKLMANSNRSAPNRRVIQTNGEAEFQIPLQPVPATERATIEASNDLVTLVATDAELRSVLRMIADHHKLNLVIGPEVSGPTTVSIRGARLDEVLDAILGVAGFHWHRVDNLLYVTGGDAASLDPRVQGRRLHVYPLNYVSANDVEPVIAGLLSPVGQVFVSEANPEDQLKTREVLVVEDNESGHNRVVQYLSQIDLQPRQVLVEAHILQIDLDDEQRHGINLTAIARVAGADVTLSGDAFAEEPEGPSLALRVKGTDMSSFLEAIKSNTNSRTLASPKVSVVNRQTAKVQIGQRLPFAVATTTQTATVQNVQFLDVGIVLTVSPVITEDGNVLMTVLPKVSGGKITESGFPEEDTTEVSTTVLMPDGGGMVIGGLIREVNSDSQAFVPKLGRVPVIKHLFRRDVSEARRNELVVALVTHVLESSHPARHKELQDFQQTVPQHAQSELRYQPYVGLPQPAFE